MVAASSASEEEKKEGAGVALQVRETLNDLITAAASNEIAKLDQALNKESQRHPDLDKQVILRQYKDANGRTALHFACHAGQIEMVKHILEFAPEGVGWEDEKGDIPFTLAVAGGPGRLDLIEALLSHGGDPNQGPTNGAHALHHAAAHNDVDVVKRLIKAGAKIEAQTETGTALHWAAGEGAKDALQALVDAGADVNAANGQNLTPVLLAAARGGGSCVAILARANADVGFILSGGGLTALHMIAEYGSTEAVKAILETEQGRRCAMVESDNGKPIHLAAWGGHREVVELLLLYSEVKETADELMAWGVVKAKEYEENHKHKEVEKALGPHHHHEGPAALPPAPTSNDDVDKAMKIKDEANRHFIAKEYEQALELYGRAIALNGRDATFWSNRSGCLMKLNRFQEALGDAEMARALKPDWPKACYRMAEGRLALKRYEDAALAAYEGIQLDGSNQSLHKLLNTAIELGRAEHQAKQQAKDGGNGGGGGGGKR